MDGLRTLTNEKPQRVLAVIPAYQEEAKVGQVVAAMKAQGFEVLVVDDHSSDGTAEVATQAGAQVIRLPTQLGYGGALQTGYLYAYETGYLYAYENGYDAVVQLDADGQHDPECAADVIAPVLADEADIVMGSRFLGGGAYPMPLIRRMGQRFFGGIAALITGRRITDPTTGYQGLSAKVLRLYCTRLFPEDYPDADMLVILHRMGIRLMEVPVKMYPKRGQSMHDGIIRPLYYIYKMTLAILMAMIRSLPKRSKP